MSEHQNQIEAVAAFGDRYREEHLDEAPVASDHDEDPFRVRFFLKRAFAGAKPETLAVQYRTRTEIVLREREPDIRNRWNGSNCGISDDELRQTLADRGVGNGRDREMVVSIVDLLGSIEDRDVTKYTKHAVERGDIDTVFETVTDVYNIGPKKATLYLRDIVSYYELETSVAEEQYKYILPIDTWVFQVGKKLGVLDTDSRDWETNSTEIVECCGDDVSPLAFNQGAWYLGGNAFEILLENIEHIEPKSD